MSWEQEMEEERKQAREAYEELYKILEIPAFCLRGYSKLEERYLKRGKKTWRRAFAAYFLGSSFFSLAQWFVVWVSIMLFFVGVHHILRFIRS